MVISSQIAIAQYPSGNGYPTPSQNIGPPNNNASWMCANQVSLLLRPYFSYLSLFGFPGPPSVAHRSGLSWTQIIQRDDFTSFNMVGVLIILAFGSVFIALDVVLAQMVYFIQSRRLHRKDPADESSLFSRARSWRYSSIYYTQAFGYLAQGSGSWDAKGPLPITTSQDDIFEPLWMRYLPGLLRPKSSDSSTGSDSDKDVEKNTAAVHVFERSPTSPTDTSFSNTSPTTLISSEERWEGLDAAAAQKGQTLEHGA